MNQILVTKKLYITPELKKKKKIYKINFILSVFLVCILISIYIYADYDRNKSEEVSQQILSQLNGQEDTTMAKDSNVLVAVLNANTTNGEENVVIPNANTFSNTIEQTTNNGYSYKTIGKINIPKINIEYAVIEGETKSVEETESLLKISPTKFWGADPNKIGNFCIVGHNYRNSKFFSKVPTLENGDIIEITDSTKRMIKYSVYDKYEVVPNDVSCTSQITNGKREITLITCTEDNKLRVIVKARAI